MKIQDLLFAIVLLVLFWKKDAKFFVLAGIISLFLAIPFFAKWIFFTGQRLTLYGAGFFFCAILVQLLHNYHENRN